MSYHPDQEFCLVTFEEQESNTSPKGKGFLGYFSMTKEERADHAQYKTVEKRNWIRRQEASQAILAAKRDRYKPVFALAQKGEVFVLGIKGRKSRWEDVAAEKIVKGTYTDKIRSIVSVRISKKGNFKDIDNWRQVLKIAEKPKSDGRSGGNNTQRNRGGGSGNKGGAPANQGTANKSRS